jgi:hypothetical protein
LSGNSGASTSWNSKGLSRPKAGKEGTQAEDFRKFGTEGDIWTLERRGKRGDEKTT